MFELKKKSICIVVCVERFRHIEAVISSSEQHEEALPSPLMWALDNTGGCRVPPLKGRICDSPSEWRRHTAAPLHLPARTNTFN